jgi:hypothetical protein
MKPTAIALTVCLLAACRPSAAQDNPSACSPPAPWPPAGAIRGHPDAEFAACLADRAYKVRNVHVPVAAAANGVIAECDVEVDHFEGAMVAPGDSDKDSVQQGVLQQATATVVRYRQCVGR